MGLYGDTLADLVSAGQQLAKTDSSLTLNWDAVITYDEDTINRLLLDQYNNDSKNPNPLIKTIELPKFTIFPNIQYVVTLNLLAPNIQFSNGLVPNVSMSIPIASVKLKSESQGYQDYDLPANLYTLQITGILLGVVKGTAGNYDPHTSSGGTIFNFPGPNTTGSVVLDFYTSKMTKNTGFNVVIQPVNSNPPTEPAQILMQELSSSVNSYLLDMFSDPSKVSAIQYTIASVNNVAPTGDVSLVPKAFQFASIGADSNIPRSYLSIFIQLQDTNHGTTNELSTVWAAQFDNLKVLPLPKAYEACLILNDDFIAQNFIVKQLAHSFAIERVSSTKPGLLFKITHTGVQVNQSQVTMDNGQHSNNVNWEQLKVDSASFDMDNGATPLLINFGQENGTDQHATFHPTWSFQIHGRSWTQFAMHILAPKFGPTMYVKASGAVDEDYNFDKVYGSTMMKPGDLLSFSGSLNNSDWNCKLSQENFWYSWFTSSQKDQFTDEMLGQAAQISSNALQFNTGTLDYFRTTNLLFPGLNIFAPDQDVGVRIPRDIIIVGQINEKPIPTRMGLLRHHPNMMFPVVSDPTSQLTKAASFVVMLYKDTKLLEKLVDAARDSESAFVKVVQETPNLANVLTLSPAELADATKGVRPQFLATAASDNKILDLPLWEGMYAVEQGPSTYTDYRLVIYGPSQIVVFGPKDLVKNQTNGRYDYQVAYTLATDGSAALQWTNADSSTTSITFARQFADDGTIAASTFSGKLNSATFSGTQIVKDDDPAFPFGAIETGATEVIGWITGIMGVALSIYAIYREIKDGKKATGEVAKLNSAIDDVAKKIEEKVQDDVQIEMPNLEETVTKSENFQLEAILKATKAMQSTLDKQNKKILTKDQVRQIVQASLDPNTGDPQIRALIDAVVDEVKKTIKEQIDAQLVPKAIDNMPPGINMATDDALENLSRTMIDTVVTPTTEKLMPVIVEPVVTITTNKIWGNDTANAKTEVVKQVEMLSQEKEAAQTRLAEAEKSKTSIEAEIEAAEKRGDSAKIAELKKQEAALQEEIDKERSQEEEKQKELDSASSEERSANEMSKEAEDSSRETVPEQESKLKHILHEY